MTLRFESYDSTETSTTDALTKLIADIERFFPQAPASYRCEDNKIGILISAIIGKPWASSAISDLHRAGVSLVYFSSDISNGLQNWIDAKRALQYSGAHNPIASPFQNRSQQNSVHLCPPELLWQSRLKNPKLRPIERSAGKMTHLVRSYCNGASSLTSVGAQDTKLQNVYNKQVVEMLKG